MAGGQERILRRRIRSVQSTQKITRAMKMISASRLCAMASAERITSTVSRFEGWSAMEHRFLAKLVRPPSVRSRLLVAHT